MLKQLPIKKEYLLGIATILVFFVCYQLAFKKTLTLWQAHSQLEAQIARTADLSVEPAYLERKNRNLDKIIAGFKADTVAFRSNIIGTISSIAEQEHVKLTEVPAQTPLYHAGQFIVEKLRFDGDFFSLSKVLSRLQSTAGIGFLRCAEFKTIDTRQASTRAGKLVLDVYLEIVAV